MSYDDARYLVDTNALSKIGRRRRAAQYFHDRAMLPSEVLHEAESSPDIQRLRQLEFKTTPGVLQALLEVMKTVPADDSSLINLYKNQGGADPILVACALVARDDAGKYLFGDEWAIVTEDQAVCALAAEFGVPVVAPGEFEQRIDEAAS
ncbi:Hypothetical protein PFR_JS9-2_1490 [Propionibacterium freudenreichii]|nr:Hypothetical protein PFR_JS9-1_1492 [Propionibacterium freudenreichii]SCQ69348.1 Hypothetical protein PFR_JS9-2_1490 [Propionibacterium freudenreichii]